LWIYRSCQLWPATAPQNTKGTGEMLQNECAAEGAADRAHSFPQVPAIRNVRQAGRAGRGGEQSWSGTAYFLAVGNRNAKFEANRELKRSVYFRLQGTISLLIIFNDRMHVEQDGDLFCFPEARKVACLEIRSMKLPNDRPSDLTRALVLARDRERCSQIETNSIRAIVGKTVAQTARRKRRGASQRIDRCKK